MKTAFFLIIAISSILGCTENQTPILNSQEAAFATPLVVAHQYQEMPLTAFLEVLLANHLPMLDSIDSQGFSSFCKTHDLVEDDSLNRTAFHRIHLLHDLFTSTDAYDCNKGGILQIPYFWHWVTPNPQHEIEYLIEKSKPKLPQVNPPSGYERYKSLAEIDRTPTLYLADLLEPKPKYHHPDCGDFYTFGWCSEREMAFSALLIGMGFESKVMVKGNHSWSEALLEMTAPNGTKKWLTAKVDNTFDKVEISDFNGKLAAWRNDLGANKIDRWYNEKARSKEEQSQLSSLAVKPEISKRIEAAVIAFYHK